MSTSNKYVSSNSAALKEAEDKIKNRKAFSYSASSDPLYREYSDRYKALGKSAMKDTVGTANALTGGYSNTYSQAAGQQAYDSYLKDLNGVLPELYESAYEKYRDEGEDLQDSYDRLTAQEDRDYSRWRDEIEDEKDDRDYEAGRQDAADEKELEQKKLDAEISGDDADRKADSFSSLYKLILSSGYSPTDAELSACGMTREAAEALRNAYLLDAGLVSGDSTAASSGSYGSGSGSGSSTSNRYASVLGQVREMSNAGSSASAVASTVGSAYSAGYITKAQRDWLLSKYAGSSSGSSSGPGNTLLK